MRTRAPTARPFGRARLWGHALSFESNEPAWRPPAYFANVRPQEGAFVDGALYTVDMDGLTILDAYEDVDSGVYERVALDVECADGTRSALVYRMAVEGRPARSGPPTAKMLSEIRAGYADWGLDPSALDRALARAAESPR